MCVWFWGMNSWVFGRVWVLMLEVLGKLCYGFVWLHLVLLVGPMFFVVCCFFLHALVKAFVGCLN